MLSTSRGCFGLGRCEVIIKPRLFAPQVLEVNGKYLLKRNVIT